MTLVDQDHIGWKSWRLIARTISATPLSSLLGGVGKIGVLENKSDNICETPKDREKVTLDYGGPIETHQRNPHPKLRSL